MRTTPIHGPVTVKAPLKPPVVAPPLPLILLDGSHVLKRDGTGISSYARILATALGASGAKVGLLLDGKVRVRKSDLALAVAVQVFGRQMPESALRRRLRLILATRFGRRRRLTAPVVQTAGVEIASLDPLLPPHDLIFNASEFFDYAHSAFTLSGRGTRIVPEEPVAAMHWTGPVPAYVANVPNIFTLHDMIPLQFPHFTLDRDARAVRLHQEVIARADHIITVSERSREDIMALLGVPEARITNTYQPVPALPTLDRESGERLVRNIYGVRPGEYVFFCGAFEPKKNLARLIEAFATAGTGLELVLAGPLGWLYTDVLDLIATIGGGGQQAGRAPVRRLGYLPRGHLVALMQCARFFAFPSIYEGFGLPVVEAMQLGTPVLASTGGSLPEIVGDAGLLVDPLDSAALSRAMRRLADDDDLHAELSRLGPIRSAQFSREAYSARLAAAYRRVGIDLTP
jgi:glycosyltransferase involved in cell wall biosynthesis